MGQESGFTKIVEPVGTTWEDVINSGKYEDMSVNEYGEICWNGLRLNRWKDVQLSDVLVDGDVWSWLVAECVTPDSEILTSTNGTTVLAKNIKENDEIAYFDFEDNTVKTGKVSKVYIHIKATNFVRYTFEDGSELEVTDYHPIYTKDGWKSQTNRNGYEKPEVGDEVKTQDSWKKLVKIEEYTGEEDCYDFAIISEEGVAVDNYFANGTLVQNSIK